MGVLLALLSAASFGVSDFAAGVGGRRGAPVAIGVIAQPFALLAAVVTVAVAVPPAPTSTQLWWGAISGVGSGVGTIALYIGLARARMSVVAPLSAVVAAAVPALVGLAAGDSLSPVAWVGIVVALPAIALVSLQRDAGGAAGAGVGYGVVAGAGFALLFIGLAKAGTAAGAWPVVAGQLVAVVVIAAVLVVPSLRPGRGRWRPSLGLGVITGVLGGIANLLYLGATGHGQLAVIAVLTSLYPAITVILARLLLHEHWTRAQAVGLVVAAVAVGMISVG